MTGKAIFELLGELSPELVDSAAEIQGRRGNFFKIAASLAAAACLVIAVLAVLPTGGGRTGPGGGVSGGLGGNGSDGWLDAIVTETGEYIVVTPVEGSPYYGTAERFVLTMTDYAPKAGNMPGDLKVGEGVRVMCNTGRFIRVDDVTVEVPIVFAIYRHVGNADIYADMDKAALAEEINRLYGGELEREIAAEDIDFERAYKIYVDTNIFALPEPDWGTVKTALDYGSYIYLLPVAAGERTVMVNIQLGLPLNPDAQFTPEEREQVLAREGHLFASAFTLYYTGQEPDYYAVIRKYVGEVPPGTVLVGGLPFFSDPVAFITFDGADALVPLSDSFDAAAIRDLELAPGVYDYAKVRDHVNSLPETDPDLCG